MSRDLRHFVIADLDGAIGDRVRAIQQQFDPKLAAEAPPHVTLIGSSGAGPIPEDTPVELLREAIEPSPRRRRRSRFGSVPPMRFLQREIVVLPLDPHGPLRALHRAPEGFGNSVCAGALAVHAALHAELLSDAHARDAETAARVARTRPWTMQTLRVYHTREPQPPTLLFDAPLLG